MIRALANVKVYGPICALCKTEFFRQSEFEPAEPCWCGQMADCGPWQWDRWRGVTTAARFRLAMSLYRLGDYITQRSPTP